MNRTVIPGTALVFILLVFIPWAKAYDLSDKAQIHGFLTQNAIHTTANQAYGKSENRISHSFTEAGINLGYQPLERLSFSAQGLFRQAGELDSGSLTLDYGLADLSLYQHPRGRLGIRMGRIKNPLGLYNETRDVAFTTPTIILPHGIYFDRSRSLFLSSDGGQLYFNHNIGTGWLSGKFNYGKIRNDNDEIRDAVLPLGATGEMCTDTDFAGQLIYGINSGEYLAAVSYADVTLSYDPGPMDNYYNGTVHFYPMIFSAQYNGDRISLTGEYLYQKNEFLDLGPYTPDGKSVSESWYLQAAYRFNYNWQILGRYGEHYLDRDSKNGDAFKLMGLPTHMGFTRDLTLALRWDVKPWMMVRGEYHRINGTSWLTTADNPDRSLTDQHHDLYALQLAFKF
jgi:hypothetical protein